VCIVQKWKSQPMHWCAPAHRGRCAIIIRTGAHRDTHGRRRCDYCKVWLKDNPAAKAVHERGQKHTDAVAQSAQGPAAAAALLQTHSSAAKQQVA